MVTTKNKEIIIKGGGKGEREREKEGQGQRGIERRKRERKRRKLWSKYQLYHNKDFANSQKWPENR